MHDGLAAVLRGGVMVDIDGTLTENGFVNTYAEFLGQPPLTDLRKQLVNYDLDTFFGATPEQAAAFWSGPYIQSCYDEIPQPGSVRVMRWLRESGVAIYYVTARGEETRRATYHWLMTRGYPVGSVLFAVRDKAKIVEDYDLGLAVEDNAYHAVRIADIGVPVLLPDWGYNRHVIHPGVHRIHNWNEVENYIKAQQVVSA